MRKALEGFYGKEPVAMTYEDYLNKTKSYYVDSFPKLGSEFDVLKTPVACFGLVREVQSSLSYNTVVPSLLGTRWDRYRQPSTIYNWVRYIFSQPKVIGIAIPSLRGGTWAHYKEIGLTDRFENIEKGRNLSDNMRCTLWTGHN
ncbi:hypothetical protein [Candidatus Finniella inopinata]|uniref:Uncharacterized protein n=1 Tax=Candidatus Finniella inopinata TaxID=1696036 RepID=A0A4Q7DLR0_9PROT|nr:hypothetical protein [Candidatus Finniella inopinata]RZI45686.1 hypothetical protein EQU50_06180 [Candidatus Finniella inopinata]